MNARRPDSNSPLDDSSETAGLFLAVGAAGISAAIFEVHLMAIGMFDRR